MSGSRPEGWGRDPVHVAVALGAPPLGLVREDAAAWRSALVRGRRGPQRDRRRSSSAGYGDAARRAAGEDDGPGERSHDEQLLTGTGRAGERGRDECGGRPERARW